jgi:hypothetical protein
MSSRGHSSDDLSVNFYINGQVVQGVVDESSPKVPANKFKANGDWHLSGVPVQYKSNKFTWPPVATTQIQLRFQVSSWVHWPIYEINPECASADSLNAGQKFSLLDASNPSNAVTYPNGFQPSSGSATQQMTLMKYTGSGSALGAASSQWSTDGSQPLKSGDTVAWYNPANSRVYDCASGACSHQLFPPPHGHWGTPYRVYKVGASTGAAIGIGDQIYFDRMFNNAWRTDKSITCSTTGCAGGEMTAKTVFKIAVVATGRNCAQPTECPPSMPYRYPGNNRCFQGVWWGNACNVDPKNDPHKHQRGDSKCACPDRRRRN